MFYRILNTSLVEKRKKNSYLKFLDMESPWTQGVIERIQDLCTFSLRPVSMGNSISSAFSKCGNGRVRNALKPDFDLFTWSILEFFCLKHSIWSTQNLTNSTEMLSTLLLSLATLDILKKLLSSFLFYPTLRLASPQYVICQNCLEVMVIPLLNYEEDIFLLQDILGFLIRKSQPFSVSYIRIKYLNNKNYFSVQ